MTTTLFPPRPKSKMLYNDLPRYEASGKWIGQRKFRGSNAVVRITASRKVLLSSRHGKPFARFVMPKQQKEEFLCGLDLEKNKEYCFNGELMNKDVNSTNEIILFDILHYGKYLFRSLNQVERLDLLEGICKKPQKLCRSQIALEVTPTIWLAQVFTCDFMARFKESWYIQQLEGLVLRKKDSFIDDFGAVEYETNNIIRCRKPFCVDNPKDKRSGGYLF